MDICKRGQIGNKEEIKKELNVGGCFIVLELWIVKQSLVLGCQIGHFVDYLTSSIALL